MSHFNRHSVDLPAPLSERVSPLCYTLLIHCQPPPVGGAVSHSLSKFSSFLGPILQNNWRMERWNKLVICVFFELKFLCSVTQFFARPQYQCHYFEWRKIRSHTGTIIEGSRRKWMRRRRVINWRSIVVITSYHFTVFFHSFIRLWFLSGLTIKLKRKCVIT